MPATPTSTDGTLLSRFDLHATCQPEISGEVEEAMALIDEYGAVLANLENMWAFKTSDALRGEHDFISERIGALRRAIDVANGDL